MTEDQQRAARMLQECLEMSLKECGCCALYVDNAECPQTFERLGDRHRRVMYRLADHVLNRMTWKKAFELPAKEE